MFGISDHLQFVSGGDVGVHKWQQIQELLQTGEVGPECTMVGDRAVDLVAAHRNGLRSAGVLWGFGSREELSAEGPGALLEDPREIVGLCRA
jgi:phosphoglycolate phosphatase